jgi:hypothetical protein
LTRGAFPAFAVKSPRRAARVSVGATAPGATATAFGPGSGFAAGAGAAAGADDVAGAADDAGSAAGDATGDGAATGAGAGVGAGVAATAGFTTGVAAVTLAAVGVAEGAEVFLPRRASSALIDMFHVLLSVFQEL